MLQEIINNLPTILCSGVVILEAANETLSKVKINRELSPRGVLVHPVPSFLLDRELKKDFKLRAKKKYSEAVKNFLYEIETKMPHVSTDALYSNIKNVKFIDKRNPLTFLFYRQLTGFYDDQKIDKRIYLLNKDYISTIYHELLHLASTRVVKKFYFSGFYQDVYGYCDYTIGEGLNEGYTELLNRRYFEKYGIDTKLKVYEYEMVFASLFEEIFSQKEMEEWYFAANLYDLVQGLKKYISENEAISILKSIDFISENIGQEKSFVLLKEVKVQYLDVICTLFSIYIEKIKNMLETGEITDKQALDLIDNFTAKALKMKLRGLEDDFFSFRDSLIIGQLPNISPLFPELNITKSK